MHTRRARALAIALIIVAIASTGCAELAPSVPALGIEAVAIERRDASDPASSRWSWGVGAGLSAGLGAMPRDVDLEDAPEPLVLAPRAPAPCRIEGACAWEVRARHRALARVRRVLDAEGAR